MKPIGDLNAPEPIAWPDTTRKAAFDSWLDAVAAPLGLAASTLRPASSDASFRRYFRIGTRDRTRDSAEIAQAGGPTCIVMDAPPPQNDVRPFIDLARSIHAAGLVAPEVLAQDATQGFLLLTDLGTDLYLDALQDCVARDDTARRDRLMRGAISTLIQWQTRLDPSRLPAYDEAFLRRELAIFPEWCVELECGVHWNDVERKCWDDACDALVASALAQPTVAMHRDYMPRNLMVVPTGGPGILDFQDAVRGPPAYDMASLLRDAFISWDEDVELDWAVRYWQAARPAGVPLPDDFGEFWRQLEWLGLQRHLKVLGIFCRLKHRDGKPTYAADLPRFFNYAHKVAARYNLLRPLSRLLEPLMGAQRVEGFY